MAEKKKKNYAITHVWMEPKIDGVKLYSAHVCIYEVKQFTRISLLSIIILKLFVCYTILIHYLVQITALFEFIRIRVRIKQGNSIKFCKVMENKIFSKFPIKILFYRKLFNIMYLSLKLKAKKSYFSFYFVCYKQF